MNLHEPSATVALALGFWTAVQPCPLTANLAAVAWLGRRVGTIAGGILAASLFIAGQVIAYVGLAWLVLAGVASSWRLSAFLQQHVNELLGPIWILTAMVLLGLLRFRLPSLRRAAPRPTGGEIISIWTSLPLGIMLALAFCPVTAVLFFVNLLTIAAAGNSHFLYSLLYALGAALPVAAFSLLLGTGSRWLGIAWDRTRQVQQWLNWVAGAVLLVVGLYSCLRFNFGLLPL